MRGMAILPCLVIVVGLCTLQAGAQTLGNWCADISMCTDPNQICGPGSMCACRPGYIDKESDSKCVDPCDNDPCNLRPTNVCSNNQGMCECEDDGRTYDAHTGECDGPCEMMNAACLASMPTCTSMGDQCQCDSANGYYPEVTTDGICTHSCDGLACFVPADPNPCVDNGGTCQCSDSDQLLDGEGMCVDPCQESTCLAVDPMCTGVGGTCTCNNPIYDYDAATTTCVDDCFGKPCATEPILCGIVDGTCSCKDEYVMDVNNNCVLPCFGKACSMRGNPHPCISSMGTCMCVEDFYTLQQDSQCGDACYDTPCDTAGTCSASGNVCECDESRGFYYKSPGVCEHSCHLRTCLTTPPRCSDNRGVCTCDNNFVFVNDGDMCENPCTGNDCFDVLNVRSCSNRQGICGCDDAFFTIQRDTQCGDACYGTECDRAGTCSAVGNACVCDAARGYYSVEPGICIHPCDNRNCFRTFTPTCSNVGGRCRCNNDLEFVNDGDMCQDPCEGKLCLNILSDNRCANSGGVCVCIDDSFTIQSDSRCGDACYGSLCEDAGTCSATEDVCECDADRGYYALAPGVCKHPCEDRSCFTTEPSCSASGRDCICGDGFEFSNGGDTCKEIPVNITPFIIGGVVAGIIALLLLSICICCLCGLCRRNPVPRVAYPRAVVNPLPAPTGIRVGPKLVLRRQPGLLRP